MADFSQEHKEEMSTKYFGIGVHKVKMVLFEFDEHDGKEYVDISVTDPEKEEKEGTARLWFHTDGAIKYSFNILRGIFVHNAPEAKKDEIRKKFDALPNTTELEKACAKMLVGKEAWLRVSLSDRTYVKNGKTKHSYNNDIFGYEPDAPEAPADDDAPATEDKATDSNLPTDF